MEPLACKCSQCDADLGRIINLWTQIGKNYITPIVAPDESSAIVTNGPTRVGDQNTLVSGCQLQDISCSECNSVLGLKCCHSPVNHVLEDNQLLLRLASVRLVNAKSGRAAKLVIKRHLKLKDPTGGTGGDTPAKPDTSAPYANGTFMPPQAQQDAHRQPQLDAVDLTGLQAYLESQRADINRIDTAGYQIVAAFDSAMDRVEREVKRLQDTMATVRHELEGNRDDVSSLKTSVDTVRKDSQVTSSETKALSSELQTLRQGTSAGDNVEELRGQLQDALAGLRQSSLDRASEANDLRRELTLTRAELRRVKDDQAALKKQVDEAKKTSKEGVTAKDHAREASALRLEMRQLRQEAAHKTPNHNQEQSGSFSTQELDILTRNIAKIGNRASQIETLQMEFQLFKSRLQRLENNTKSPARDEYSLPSLADEAEQHQDGLARTSAQRRKRPPVSREKVERESTPNKRLAFSSDVEGEGAPDFATLGSPLTSPLGISTRGRTTARRGATQSARSGVSGRKNEELRNKYPAVCCQVVLANETDLDCHLADTHGPHVRLNAKSSLKPKDETDDEKKGDDFTEALPLRTEAAVKESPALPLSITRRSKGLLVPICGIYVIVILNHVHRSCGRDDVLRSGRVLVINAKASLADKYHPNVLTATLRPSFLYGILVTIVCSLPLCLQAPLREYWPILFLPQRFILKKEKRGWADEFDNEKAMYARLAALQGHLIPIFYGEVEFEGSRALVMSFIDGPTLSEITHLTVERVRVLAEEALLPLQYYGVVPDDMKLDNFILVGEDGLVLIDLEHVDEPDIPEEMTETAKSAVFMLLDNYKACQNAANMDW